MSESRLLSQRTFADIVLLIRTIKDEAAEAKNWNLWGQADQVDALLRRLVYEITTECMAGEGKKLGSR